MADDLDPLTVLREAVGFALDTLGDDDHAETRRRLAAALEATEPKPQTFRLGLVVELDVEAFSEDEAVARLRANAEAGPGVHRVEVCSDPADIPFFYNPRIPFHDPPSVYAARTGEKADHPFVASFQGGSLCALPDCRLPQGDHYEKPNEVEPTDDEPPARYLGEGEWSDGS